MTDAQTPTTYIATFNMDTSREREKQREREIKRETQPDEHTDAASSHFIWIAEDMASMIKPEMNSTGKLLKKKIMRGHGDMMSDEREPPVS